MNMGGTNSPKHHKKHGEGDETAEETQEEGEEVDSDGDAFDMHEWVDKMGRHRSIKKKKRKKFDKDDHDYTA